MYDPYEDFSVGFDVAKTAMAWAVQAKKVNDPRTFFAGFVSCVGHFVSICADPTDKRALLNSLIHLLEGYRDDRYTNPIKEN